MAKSSCLFGRGLHTTYARYAALPLRLIVGYGFLVHGLAKWSKGPQAFAAILHAAGVPAPHLMAWATIIVEMVGGVAFLLGAFVSLMSIPATILLVVAIVTVHWPNGFSSVKLLSFSNGRAQFGPPGYECDLLYIACIVTLVLMGPSAYSVDALQRRESPQKAANSESARSPNSRLFTVILRRLSGHLSLFPPFGVRSLRSHMNQKRRIVIVGGGFAGLYAALELDKALAARDDIEITLINRENFFLFTPMLHEIAAGDLDLTNIVNPVCKLLKNVAFFQGEVKEIDLERRRVLVGHGFDSHSHALEFDQIVLPLGSAQFFGLPGVEDHALTMKSLSDAIRLRNRLIALLEAADTECSQTERRELLSVAVAGTGFAGVETLASINDFLRNSLRFYPNVSPADLRLTLIHPGDVILPELSAKLGTYAQRKQEERGIGVMAHSRVTSYDGSTIELAGGKRLGARTLIWTAGTMPNPLISMLPCGVERGRVKVTPELAVPDWPGMWALGDCALVPDLSTGKFCPPTDQHALRQGKIVAQNILAQLDDGEFRSFNFKTIGQLATIGHRTGVASIFGLNVSGFPAWWMWRTIYLSRLPRLEKKIRVALDWTLDPLFSKDLCQFIDVRQEHKMSNEGLRHLQEPPHRLGPAPEQQLVASAIL